MLLTFPLLRGVRPNSFALSTLDAAADIRDGGKKRILAQELFTFSVLIFIVKSSLNNTKLLPRLALSVLFYCWKTVCCVIFCCVSLLHHQLTPLTPRSIKFSRQNNFSFPFASFSLHSDGKVRIYRLSTAIRRLNQENRWQKLKSIHQQHQQQSTAAAATTARNNRIRRLNQQEQQQQLFAVLRRRNQNNFRT